MRCLVLLLASALYAAPPKAPKDLFSHKKIWTIHLTLTPDQFAAMEPKGGPPGGPGMRMPGPAMMLLPAFLKADTNADSQLSASEFNSLAASWFDRWDTNKRGSLSAEDFRAGFTRELPAPPMMGGPGGPPPNMGLDFPYVHASLDFEGQTLPGVAVRYKGNSTFMMSRGQLKRSLKIDLNRFSKSTSFAGQTTLNLHSNVMDPSFMNEQIGYRMFRDAGIPAPRTAFARVYLTVPGQHSRKYVGLYSLVEEVDENFEREALKQSGGLILKPETHSLFADLGPDWKKYKDAYDPKTSASPAQRQRLLDFARLVSSASDSDFAAQAPRFLDLDKFARYLALNTWQANMDSIYAMGHNFYLYLHPKTNLFEIWPWDLDLSFGGFGAGAQMPIDKPWRGQNRFLERLFALDAFTRLYKSHLATANRTLGEPRRLASQVDQLAALIRPAVADESDVLLSAFERRLSSDAPSTPPPTPRGPGGPGGPGGLPVKAFALARVESVADQLAGKPAPQSPPGPRGGPMLFAGFLAPALLRVLDTDADGSLSRQEMLSGFSRLFADWGGTADSPLTREQLRSGLEKLLPPPPGPGMIIMRSLP